MTKTITIMPEELTYEMIAANGCECGTGTGSGQDNEEYIRADYAAMREAAPKMRLKPLEWSDDLGHFGFGWYQVYLAPTTETSFEVLDSRGCIFGRFNTEAEAKAAAEADYKRRAMEMWETGDD